MPASGASAAMDGTAPGTQAVPGSDIREVAGCCLALQCGGKVLALCGSYKLRRALFCRDLIGELWPQLVHVMLKVLDVVRTGMKNRLNLLARSCR